MIEQKVILPAFFRELGTALLVSLVVLLLVVLAMDTPAFHATEQGLYDGYFRLRGRLPHPDEGRDREARASYEVVLIEIDAQSDAALAPVWGPYPYPRAVYAALLRQLTWEGDPPPPERVVLDLPLAAPSTRGAQDDARLAAQLTRLRQDKTRYLYLPCTYAALDQAAGRAQPPAPWRWRGQQALARIPSPLPVAQAHWANPLPAFLSPAPRAGGVAVLPLEADGRSRRVPLGIRTQGAVYPELTYAVKFDYLKSVEAPSAPDAFSAYGDVPPVDARHLAPINFAGPLRGRNGRLLPPAQRAFTVYPLSTVLAMTPAQARAAFGSRTITLPGGRQRTINRIVLVGLALPGVTERTPSPYDPVYHYPVETRAHILRMHLEENYLTPAHPAWGWMLAALIAVVMGFSLTFLPALRGTALTAGMVLGLLLAGYFAFTRHYLVPMLAPVLTALAIYPVTMTIRLAREERRRRSLQRHFSQYLSTELVMQLMENPENYSLEVPEEREVAILFADLRNFTFWSSSHTTEEVFAQLNEFLAEMSRVVEDYGGSVDKFIGDAIMALFGAPAALENPSRTAVLAALEMQERLDELNRQWEMEGRDTFQMGIAVHTGVAKLGEIGAEVRRNYTAIGSTVNVAARLEEKTKEYGVRILATRATLEYCAELLDFREIGPVSLRGIGQPLIVYEVLARKGAYRPAASRKGERVPASKYSVEEEKSDVDR